MVGVIRQPSFLFYDSNFLSTLPRQEWVNGFAEIIKHGAVLDAKLFKQLSAISLKDLKEDKKLLTSIVRRNVELKSSVVKQDEFEQGDRKLLNFGHTIGHAIEKAHSIPHGQAVGLGILYACKLSEVLRKFDPANTLKIKNLLQQYQLPTHIDFSNTLIDSIVKHDKKSNAVGIDFILLDTIGKPYIENIPLDQLKELIAASTL